MPLKAYRFRIYPNKTQQKKLAQFFGAKRFAWNTCLSWRSDAYKTFSESVTGVDFSRELTWLKKLDSYHWLKDVPATVLTQGILDQDNAFRRYFKEGAGYPKYKARHDEQKIRFQMDQRIVTNLFRAGEFLKLTGLGEIKVRWTRQPGGIPKMVSLSKDKAGRYFISMAVEEDIQTKAIAQGAIGIDLGINNAMILSDGTTIDNPRHLKRYKEQLKKLQQRLSRQTKKSNRWLETKRRIAKIHARTADCRREFIHRTTSKIVDENQIILIEDLNVKGMTASGKGTQEKPGKMVKQKSGLNRALLDVSLSEAIRQLEYKAAWYGRTLRKVDRFYPSSKTCSCCGHKLDKLSLDVRAWTCPDCNTTHDRDLNAAINIRDEGLRNMTPVGILGEVRDAGGEGACPMSVSPRSLDQSTACLEQVGRVI